MCWTRLWRRCLLRPCRRVNTSRTCTRASNWLRRSYLRFLESIKLELYLAYAQVFGKHGLVQENPVGEKFDPNKHDALFQVCAPVSTQLGLSLIIYFFRFHPLTRSQTLYSTFKRLIFKIHDKLTVWIHKENIHLCRLATSCKEEQSDLRLWEFLGNLEKFCETGTKAHFVLTRGDLSEAW